MRLDKLTAKLQEALQKNIQDQLSLKLSQSTLKAGAKIEAGWGGKGLFLKII